MEDKQKLFDLIDNLGKIKLREDPVEYGLTDLNIKIAKVDNNKSIASRIANKVIKILGDKKRKLEILKDIYDIKYNKLLASNEKVAEGESKDERIAIAKGMLIKERKKILKLQAIISEKEDMLKCVNNCLKSLKASKEALSRQLSVVKDQIYLGEVDSSKFASK